MEAAYLETSAINKYYDKRICARAFKQILESRNLIVAMGVWGVYELQKTFLTFPNRAQDLFQWVKVLEPKFVKREDLYKIEVNHLKNNTFPQKKTYFVNSDLEEMINNIIHEFSEGYIDKIFIDKMEGRQEELDRNRAMWGVFNEQKKDVNASKLDFKNIINSFLNEDNIYELVNFFKGTIKHDINASSVIVLKSNINAFPALRAFLYSHLYIDFITIKGKNTPAEDRFTDSLHLIESSYCDDFISCDVRHLKYANMISPDIKLSNGITLLEDFKVLRIDS